MGEIDRKMKEYFSDRRRYADLWNGSAFGGRQLIREEELAEAGTVALHGMMDFQTASGQQDARYMELEGKLRELVPDYPVHILDLSAEGDYSSFRTELRLLFELYACRDSREKLKGYLESHEECSHADIETCRLLGTMMDIRQLEMIQEKESGKGGADMCKALMDWSLEERAEGRAEGKTEGEERMACLTKILLDQHKMSDLDKMLSDTGYRNKLFQEYGLA